MNSPGEMWEELRAEQDRERERAQFLPAARALRNSWRPPRRKGALVWQLAAAAAFAAVCTLGWRLAPHLRGHENLAFLVGSAGEPGQVGAWIAAPSGDPLPLQFSDGTLFTLAAGSRARVSAVDANGARIVVERGRASASVVHRASSHWLVDVGPFAVNVTGTRFDVSWDANDEVFRLALREGSVLVSGPCLRAPRPIDRGHVLRVLCKGGREEIIETRADDPEVDLRQTAPVAAADATPSSEDPRYAQAVVPPELPPRAADGANFAGGAQAAAFTHPASTPLVHTETWRRLISAGRYREALDLVERTGFEQQCAKASGADLLELGDAARFAGNPLRARQAYLAARAKLPGGGRSTYGLGLTAFDKERDFVSAARWFETYLNEQPDGLLRREAEGRLMEAWERASNREKARQSAEQYLRDYPDGTQAPLARQLATH
ncbi:MAG: FecR domain-containing protein [Myxococcota bacterium]|nr:FecR domain-containing protein [Myxococcota bacterium]